MTQSRTGGTKTVPEGQGDRVSSLSPEALRAWHAMSYGLIGVDPSTTVKVPFSCRADFQRNDSCPSASVACFGVQE